jgi:hypothetical protein
MCIEAISNAICRTQDIVFEGVDTTKRCFERNFNCTVEELSLKVYHVAIFLLVAISASLLFIVNSTFFALGAFTALFHKESFDDAILRIQTIWLTQSCTRQAIMAFVSILAWPLSSLMMGAYICSSLQDEAFTIVHQPEGYNGDGGPHASPDSSEEGPAINTIGPRNGFSLPAAANSAPRPAPAIPVQALEASADQSEEGLPPSQLALSVTGADFSSPSAV